MDRNGRSGLGLAADELRRMRRDLAGGLRATGREVAGEGRNVLRDLDAPHQQSPGFFRRGWRAFRRAPLAAQLAVAIVAFALWALVVFGILLNDRSPKSPPQPLNQNVALGAPRQSHERAA